MYRKVIGMSLMVGALAACGGGDAGDEAAMEEPTVEEEAPAAAVEGVGEEAIAHVVNGQGTEIGTIALTQEADGVHMEIDLAFLQGGMHGFHIHEVGSCEGEDFADAGGHFNPTNAEHGFESAQGPHAGDIENLDVYPDDGTAVTGMTIDRVTLAAGQPNSLLDGDGSAFIVHQRPDDYTTQPSGDSGARIACGVIEPA